MSNQAQPTTATTSTIDDSESTVVAEADGHRVAVATVVNDHGEIWLSFRVHAGHLPAHVREQLVDAVFELPELLGPSVIRASIPLGDTELLDALRSHCDELTTRAAGATCLVDATVDSN